MAVAGRRWATWRGRWTWPACWAGWRAGWRPNPWNIPGGGGAIKVEFAVALKKIYGAGEPVARREPAAVVDVEAAPGAAEKERAGVGVSTN